MASGILYRSLGLPSPLVLGILAGVTKFIPFGRVVPPGALPMRALDEPRETPAEQPEVEVSPN